MPGRDLSEHSGIKVWEAPVRDKETGEETTRWKATVEDDEDVPDCVGDSPLEAVDVLLEGFLLTDDDQGETEGGDQA